MHGAVDTEHQHVHLAAIFGKPAGQFFTDNDIGPMRNLQRAFDRVVIGDGDEIHPTPNRLFVNLRRRAVALGTVNRIQRGFAGAIAGQAVAVQIDPARRWR